jgi:hypothetical protein
MDSARHVIKCSSNPHSLSQTASYDAASTLITCIHLVPIETTFLRQLICGTFNPRNINPRNIYSRNLTGARAKPGASTHARKRPYVSLQSAEHFIHGILNPRNIDLRNIDPRNTLPSAAACGGRTSPSASQQNAPCTATAPPDRGQHSYTDRFDVSTFWGTRWVISVDVSDKERLRLS